MVGRSGNTHSHRATLNKPQTDGTLYLDQVCLQAIAQPRKFLPS
jgi:hypothetical protein